MAQWFPLGISSVAEKIDRLFWLATVWTGATGLVIVAILLFFIIRYRRRHGHSAFYTHGDNRGSHLLTLTLAALVFIALDLNLAYHDHLVWEAMFGRPPSVNDALLVEVMPEQFAWNVRYAGADHLFGTADDVVTMNDLHVPVGKPVIVQLTSRDVIHSFFLPNLRIKQDAIPGMVTTLYFQPETVGDFNIACAQHCGLGHYRMKGAFVVESDDQFQRWMVEKLKESADSPAPQWAWDWSIKKES